jgi:hypothetical protein
MRVALGPAGASYVAVAEECSMWQSQSTEAASGIRGAQAGGCTREGVGEKGEIRGGPGPHGGNVLIVFVVIPSSPRCVSVGGPKKLN